MQKKKTMLLALQTSGILIKTERPFSMSNRREFNGQRSEQRETTLNSLQVGQVIKGTVKNITNYGAFIDIGGIDGLLHITDMAWKRVGHPSELLNVGDKIDVKVLAIDKGKERISLGIKQLQDNPWEKTVKSIIPGSVIRGTISNITDYGMFVTIAKGVDGLVHISEVSSDGRVDNLHHMFNVGQDIDVKVLNIDNDKRRISLSLKQA